jgi:aspartate aminotransferase-like enzyme/N-acyl-L-homoserine lactone synthetase
MAVAALNMATIVQRPCTKLYFYNAIFFGRIFLNTLELSLMTTDAAYSYTIGGDVFKIACEPWEFEAIHRLNYKTFVEEIPQHAPNPEAQLVDRFHGENTYFICVRGEHPGRLLAMVCLRSTRPFSLDLKLANLDQYLPPRKSLCEIRLLAVEPEVRGSRVTLELFRIMARYAIAQGYDLGIMSGTTRQTKLYARIGFVPFGPLVGKGEATYQPMYLSLAVFASQTLSLLKLQQPAQHDNLAAIFLPGPVMVSKAVREAMQTNPISHRAASFTASLRDVKNKLCKLTGAHHVDVLLGSGTLANDMVAAQLKLENAHGLILSNGEFGDRLIDHATRQQLSFQTISIEWGATFDVDEIAGMLNASPKLKWLWMTHCETSTGVLNNVAAISALCRARNVAICLDCISALGVVPVDLEHAYLATGVSGKGLAAYPGLSMVFRNHAVTPAQQALPRYLDLGLYANDTNDANDGADEVPFTHSSNLVQALDAALGSPSSAIDWGKKFQRITSDGESLRTALRKRGYSLIADGACVSPAVITIELNNIANTAHSMQVGEALETRGFYLSYRSRYLSARNWLQICLMGAYAPSQLSALVEMMDVLVKHKSV